MDGRMFNGLAALLIFVGVVVGFMLFVVIPWLWRFAKPWIHTITA